MKNTQEGDVVVTTGGTRGVVEIVSDGMIFIKTGNDDLVVVYPYEITSNPMALQRIYEECPLD